MTTYDVLVQAFYDEEDPEAEAPPLETIASGLEDLMFFWSTIAPLFERSRFFVVARLDGGLVLTSAPSAWLEVLALPGGWCPPVISKLCSDYTVEWESIGPEFTYDLEVSVDGIFETLLEDSSETIATWSAFDLLQPVEAFFRLTAKIGGDPIYVAESDTFIAMRDLSPACIAIVVPPVCPECWSLRARPDCENDWHERERAACGVGWTVRAAECSDEPWRQREIKC